MKSILWRIVLFSVAEIVGTVSAVAEAYVPRVSFGARLEPGNFILHGAGQDAEGFNEYRAAFDPDHQPLITMTYIGLTNPVATVTAWGQKLRAELASVAPHHMIPQIGLSFVQDAQVAAGAYDAQIAAFGDALASLGRPVFIRIGYEFEGSWNDYKPASFRAAWIRIATMLRSRGLPFATVWCAAGASSGWPSMTQLLSYYPGDEWVDWWGVDIFSEGESTKPQLAGFLDAARARRKPVMIGEMTPRYVGVLLGQKSWDRWHGPIIELLKRRPEIKATAYINWNWLDWSNRLGFAWHDWGDARLASNATVRDAWVAAMQDPIFLHASTGGLPLAPPATFHAFASGTTQATLIWSAGVGLAAATGYRIERARDQAFRSGLVSFDLKTTATSHVDSTAVAGTTCYYRLLTVGAAGQSAPTDSVEVKLPLTLGATGASFANIATRAYCSDGNKVTVGGFVIPGASAKQVLIRAVGPTLASTGLGQSEVLADPVIDLYRGAVVIATNDNWSDNANAAAIGATAARVGAFPLATSDVQSSALLLTLPPGAYTLIARGKVDPSGIVLIEIYDAD